MNIGTATLSGGVATLVITPAVTGSYTVYATYAGDCTFSGSTSNSCDRYGLASIDPKLGNTCGDHLWHSAELPRN